MMLTPTLGKAIDEAPELLRCEAADQRILDGLRVSIGQLLAEPCHAAHDPALVENLQGQLLAVRREPIEPHTARA